MKITNIYIQNFKSIEKLEFKPNRKLNAFIGCNSSGKSNIFEAINFVPGYSYPTPNSIAKEDRYKGDNFREISIRIDFDDNNYIEFAENWEDKYGNFKSGLNKTGGYCKSEDRLKYCSAYVGIEREITDFMPSNKWSLMGRLLQEINSKFLEESVVIKEEKIPKKDLLTKELDRIRDELLFSVKDEDGTNIMGMLLTILQEECAKQINSSDCDFDIKLNLYDPWNFYRTLQLLVREKTMNLELKASQIGMGIQASLTIAMLKAYAELKLRNKPPIFIDEPELFLHPHAQRTFYSVLRELNDNGTQIFYTTHSPDFLSVKYLDEIFLVRKNIQGTYLRYADLNKFIDDLHMRLGISSSKDDLRLHYSNAYENTGNSKEANEAFFANKIILVEGQSENLILPYFFSKENFEYVKKGISIVCCGSKGELDRFYRLYTEFGIPCYVVFDGDKQLVGTKEEKSNIRKNRNLFSILDPTNNSDYPDNTPQDKYLGFTETFNENLGFEISKKGLDLFLETKKKYENGLISKPQWIEGLIEKIENLDSECKSILQTYLDW
jgi:putative ATP-dependent endonuclease of the OLD family